MNDNVLPMKSVVSSETPADAPAHEDGIVPIRSEENSELVRALTDLLYRAKTGEVDAVAVVEQRKDNNAAYRISGRWYFGFSLIGALSMLTSELKKEVFEQMRINEDRSDETT